MIEAHRGNVENLFAIYAGRSNIVSRSLKPDGLRPTSSFVRTRYECIELILIPIRAGPDDIDQAKGEFLFSVNDRLKPGLHWDHENSCICPSVIHFLPLGMAMAPALVNDHLYFINAIV